MHYNIFKPEERTLFYFPLESVKSRYTQQLCEEWMPNAFNCYTWKLVTVEGSPVDKYISVGVVLDAVARGIYSTSQCQKFLTFIQDGKVKNGDIIYLQDFWTPGIESIFYALDLYNIDVKIYSMLHAQSVDEYDFTYNMRHWMRHYELGLDKRSAGIFVGSTVHREQLRAAGFQAPIHVVSLPLDYESVFRQRLALGDVEKKNQVVFTSRFDNEKNPYFLLEVAKKFLEAYPDYTFVVTTGAKEIRSNLPGIRNKFLELAKEQPRFIIKEHISKDDYYKTLCESKVQFNCSLQDYVSWTLLEATTMDCNVAYPNFRCFPEILNKSQMYKPFDIQSALFCLQIQLENTPIGQNRWIPKLADLGRQFESYVMYYNVTTEYNIWHQKEQIEELIYGERKY